jgi:hypothetical protein
MRTLRFAIAGLGLLTLAGCSAKYDLAGTSWAKPNTMVQQVTLDEIDCAREAREASHTPDLILGGLIDVGRYFYEERQRFSTYERCMVARGYARTSS